MGFMREFCSYGGRVLSEFSLRSGCRSYSLDWAIE